MDQRILEFHGIGVSPRSFTDDEAEYWVSVAQFEAALDLVLEVRQDPGDILLTFDDGNRSDFEIALPRLLERGLTGHFFVLAGRLGWPCSLSGTELRQMTAAGMTIGLHGFDHVSWREATEEVLDREIAGAREVLARAARCEINEVAIPFGRYNGRVLRRLRGQGFRTVYSSDGGHADAAAWLKPRLAVKRTCDVASLRSRLEGVEPLVERGVRQAKMLVKRWI